MKTIDVNKRINAPHGAYRDWLRRADGAEQDLGWRSNRVVARCRELLAAFMRGDGAVEPGIRFIALGQGAAGWDTVPPAAPTAGDEQLVDGSPVTFAIGDPALALSYLDATGSEAGVISHRLQVTLSLDPGALPVPPGEGAYPLREFGLFGRYDGSDYMIDYVRHPVINVGPADSLVRRIRLVF